MKKLHLIAPLLALSATGLVLAAPASSSAQTSSAAARGGSPQPPPEWAELFGGASLPVVWQSATAARDRIAEVIAARGFDGIAAWAETVHLASHALLDQVKLDDPERQKRLHGALSQCARIADDVLDAASHQQPEQLAESFRRMNSALDLVGRRLPKPIVDAPKQPVRFAKSPAPPVAPAAKPQPGR